MHLYCNTLIARLKEVICHHSHRRFMRISLSLVFVRESRFSRSPPSAEHPTVRYVITSCQRSKNREIQE